MKLLLAFLLCAGAASAQDDVDAAIRGLSEKLAKDGMSGKLAAIVATDWGVQAVREKIEALLAHRVGRLERDAIGYYEDYLFSTDEKGDLRLRPERREDFELLAARLPTAMNAMAAFNRRCLDLASRLEYPNALDQRARAAWLDSNFRVAFFHRHPAELRELNDEEILDLAGFRGLEHGKDGKLHVAGPWAPELRDRIALLFAHLEAVKPYEKSYLKLVAQLPEAESRRALGSDFAALFLIGRVLRQGEEGAPAPIGTLTEGDEEKKVEPSVAFNPDLSSFAEDVRMGTLAAAALQPTLDHLAAALAEGKDELDLREFLKNERIRILLSEFVHGRRQEQRKKADEIWSSLLEDGFTQENGKLAVKKGRYADEDGKDSVEVLNAELNGIVEEFDGSMRADFDHIAEHCVDPAVVAAFENRAGTYLLAEQRDRVIERLVDTERRRGFDGFVRAFLEAKGDGYIVRPDRTTRIDAILRRAEAIRKEQAGEK
jgi:hypothetical protein